MDPSIGLDLEVADVEGVLLGAWHLGAARRVPGRGDPQHPGRAGGRLALLVRHEGVAPAGRAAGGPPRTEFRALARRLRSPIRSGRGSPSTRTAVSAITNTPLAVHRFPGNSPLAIGELFW